MRIRRKASLPPDTGNTYIGGSLMSPSKWTRRGVESPWCGQEESLMTPRGGHGNYHVPQSVDTRKVRPCGMDTEEY